MDIVEKLRSQIGDDVQRIFDHESLFCLAADEIDRLRGLCDEAGGEIRQRARNPRLRALPTITPTEERE